MQPQPKFHIIDFEGTLSSGILEYGVVTLQNWKIVHLQTRFCKPIGEIDPADIRLHGITRKETENALPFADDWEYFASLRETGTLVAHCASVENNFLKSIWPYARKSPDFINPGKSVNTWGPWIDTCQLYRTLYPQFKSHKLNDLIKTFDLQNLLSEFVKEHCPKGRQKPHCALHDALASALLLMQLKELTLEKLLIFSASNEQRQNLNQISLELF